MPRLIHIVPLLALAPALALPAAADDHDWRAELAAQMRAEEDCVVAFYTNVLERDVDGRSALFVHIVCEDGRAFDGRRFEGMQKPFTVRPCDVDVC